MENTHNKEVKGLNENCQGKFFWAYDQDGPYYGGPFNTREEAIEEGRVEAQAFGHEEFIIGVADSATIVEIDADRLLDNLAEETGEELYEDAMDGWCDDIKFEDRIDLGTRLTHVLHAWLAEHKERTHWHCIRQVGESIKVAVQ